MRTLLAAAALGAGLLATPALANHIFNPGPYASNGDCEAERAALSNDDVDTLLARFPNLFSSKGEVRSFLNRAFTCEPGNDGQWYLRDRRQEIFASEWFQRRL